MNIIQCKVLTMHTEDQHTPHIELELCIDFFQWVLIACLNKRIMRAIEYMEINERVCHIF